MNSIKISNKPICFWGDTHGDWRKDGFIQHLIRTRNLSGSNVIQVGDFGIGFREDTVDFANLQNLNDALIKDDIHLYVIRGNHDNPKYFKGGQEFSNILFLPDYTVLVADNVNILCVGGAVSIDRTTSKKAVFKTGRHHWWKDEVFVYDEGLINSIIEAFKIHIVVTHSAPSAFYPQTFNNIVFDYAAVDPILIQDLIAERKRIDMLHDNIVEKNKISHWFYGHFHNCFTEYHNEMKAVLLNINEIYYLNNF